MTSYQVDSEAVLAQSTAARGTVGRIQSETASLHSQLEQLQSSWTGGAATAFHALVSEWRAAQQRVDESLTALSTALAQAGQQYAEAEHNNARLFLR